MENDVFQGLGVEVALKRPDDFSMVVETLTRIGIASEKSKTLFQSCHILHKRGRYAIVHFKELFVLDGKTPTHDDEDLARRDYIAGLLADWDLVDIISKKELIKKTPSTRVKIISHREKSDWKLVHKYSIGK